MTMAASPPPWSHLTYLLQCTLLAWLALLAVAMYAWWARQHARRMALRYPTADPPWLLAKLQSLLPYALPITLVRTVMSVLICVAYVCFTYLGEIPRFGLVAMRVFAVLMLGFLLLVVVNSDRPLWFICYPLTLIELLSIASLFLADKHDWLNFSFLQAYVVMSGYFSLEPVLEISFVTNSSQFQRQLTRRAVEFIVFIYVLASGLQLFERMGEPWATFSATTFELTLANAFYFTVVTIFTVGYGDFVPFTLLGRLWIICIIVFGAYLVSRKIGQVIDVFSDFRRGRGSFVKPEDTEHCVICGNVKWEYLKSFIQEFYGEARNEGKKLVVICENPNWTEDTWNKFFAVHPLFRQHVVYLEGACMSREDLIRAQVETAESVFILCNQHNPDPYGEDSETLKRILMVRSYAPKIPIYSMCALHDSMLQISIALEHLDEHDGAEDGVSRRPSMANLNKVNKPRRSDEVIDDQSAPSNVKDYLDDDDDDDDDGLLVQGYDGGADRMSESICMQEVEMSLMAENVFCNGLSTLLANLILRIDPISKASDNPWAIEYKIGSECRFESATLPTELEGRKFGEVATIMYDFGVLMIATKRFMQDSGWKPIDPNTELRVNMVGLIITYHSTKFLDAIMAEIANRVRMLFDDSGSEGSTMDLDEPSMDEEFSNQGDIARHTLAGSYLAGDVPMAEFSGDEYGLQHHEYAFPRSHSIENPSPRTQPMHTHNDVAPETQSFDNLSRSAPLSSVLASAASAEHASDVRAALAQSFPLDSVEPDSRESVEEEPQLTNSEQPELHEQQEGEQNSQQEQQEQQPQTLPPTPPSSPPQSQEQEQQPEALHTESSDSPAIETTVDTRVPTFRQDLTTDDDTLTDVEATATGNAANANLQGSQADIDTHAQQTSDLATPLRAVEPPQLDNSELSAPENDITAPLSAPVTTTAPVRRSVRWSGNHQSRSRNSSVKRSSRTSMDSSSSRGSSEKRSYPLIYYADEPLPTKMKGHVVVCAIGDMSMLNLKYFLERLWFRRVPSGVKNDPRASKRTPVVAICSSISEDDEAELSALSSDELFLIEGNSLSVRTLRSAQYERAMSIVILACEDKTQVEDMDAKAIFTVMTLDQLLSEKSNTFVCTMLDAEESMQLLRAPNHPRRREAFLGSVAESYLQYNVKSSFHGTNESYLDGDSRLEYRRGQNAPPSAVRTRTLSFGALSATSGLPQSMSFVGIWNNTYTDRRETITSLVTGDADHHPKVRKSNKLKDNILSQNYSSIAAMSSLNLFVNHATPMTIGGGGRIVPEDSALGRYRGALNPMNLRNREESFEKPRYASGEMIISSTFMTLLIREYTMPGLIGIVRKIFGTRFGKGPRSKGCWIRTISVPKQWIRSSPNGERMYREVFERLIHFGAVALGLYRAGDVKVRMQLASDPEPPPDAERAANPVDNLDSPPVLEATEALQSDMFSSPDVTDTDVTFEMGGDSTIVDPPNRSYEHTSLLSELPTYGAAQTAGELRANDPQLHGASDGDTEHESSLDDEGLADRTHVPLPPDMYVGMAEDVTLARENDDEYDANGLDAVVSGHYTCPTTGRESVYQEHDAGNDLPYVYTNPEPYTLVSERDAVYVLVHPQTPIPDEW